MDKLSKGLTPNGAPTPEPPSNPDELARNIRQYADPGIYYPGYKYIPLKAFIDEMIKLGHRYEKIGVIVKSTLINNYDELLVVSGTPDSFSEGYAKDPERYIEFGYPVVGSREERKLIFEVAEVNSAIAALALKMYAELESRGQADGKKETEGAHGT